MITESRHYYESTERRDFTKDVTFPSLFSQSTNEHRACGCTGRGQKKRSRQARGNTKTKQKRKQTKTLQMISTAYNNVAACKNLWTTIVFVVKRWKHSPEDYAYQNVRQRPSKVYGACCSCTDDDGAAASLTNMHGLERERGSEFLCEREREEWREAALISFAPRFSSSPTGLSFFLIQLHFIQIQMRIQNPFVSLRESDYMGWDMQTKRIDRCIFLDQCIRDGKSTILSLSVVDYRCSSASNPLGKKPSSATVKDVQCETCPFSDIQDEFR